MKILNITLIGHSNSVLCTAISQNNSIAVTGSEDETALIWNLDNGKLIFNLTGHAAPVTTVAISNDNSKVVTGS